MIFKKLIQFLLTAHAVVLSHGVGDFHHQKLDKKHVCIHDKRFKNLTLEVMNYTILESVNDTRRFLSTSPSFHRMRISIDYGSNKAIFNNRD